MAYPYDNTPKKTRILEALRNNLACITPANGYRTDVQRAAIYEGDEILFGHSLPGIVIVPDSKDVQETRFTHVQVAHNLNLSIVLGMTFLPNTSTDVWNTAITGFVEDVVKAVEDDIQLGGLVVYVEPLDDEVFDISPEDQIAEAQVTVRMEYRHTVGDPAA